MEDEERRGRRWLLGLFLVAMGIFISGLLQEFCYRWQHFRDLEEFVRVRRTVFKHKAVLRREHVNRLSEK